MTNQTQEVHDLSLDVGDGLDGLVVGGLGPTGRPMPNLRTGQPLPSSHSP